MTAAPAIEAQHFPQTDFYEVPKIVETFTSIEPIPGEAALGDTPVPYTAWVGGSDIAIIVPGFGGIKHITDDMCLELAKHDLTVIN